MDSAFDYAENADHFLQQDNGYIGIVSGLEVVEETVPDLTVDIAAGVAYDQDGQRVAVSATQNLDLSQDSNAVSTAVAGGGNEKWISVFIAFERALSDPRVDGNGTPLNYERSESFQFVVDQGAEAAAGAPAVYTAGNTENYTLANGQTLEVVVDGTTSQTVTFNTGDFVSIASATAAEVAAVITSQVTGATGGTSASAVTITSAMTGPSASIRVTGGTAAAQFAWPTSAAIGSGGPSRPALRADAILLADVLFRNGGSRVNDAPDPGMGDHVIDLVARRETVFAYTGASFNIKVGTITEFASAVAQELTNHINETGASHPASALSYDPTSQPIPGTWSATAAAGELQAAIDGIVSDLGQVTGTTGANLIGFNNSAAALPASPSNVQAALDDLFGGTTIVLAASTYQFDGDIVSTSGVIDLGSGELQDVGSVLYADGPRDISGFGSPEGARTADPGSTYRNRTGGAGTSFYVKESGVGNTGWVAK